MGNDHHERYLHMSTIIASLQILEKLICSNPSLGVELKDCLYSRNILTSLTGLLLSQDYNEYIKEMTRRNLDWRNPSGTSVPWKKICWGLLETMEGLALFRLPPILPLEAVLHYPRTRPRVYLLPLNNLILNLRTKCLLVLIYIVAGNSDWIKPGSHYKFPCPLQGRNHEIATCSEFLTITPKDRWVKIPRGRICYTCLKPKGTNGVCKTRRCTEEKTIPQVLLCAACTPWAAAKGWASFSILMYRKQEHGKDPPKCAKVRKFLEKYLGKINTAIPESKLSYAVNFNYQVYSVSVSCLSLSYISRLDIETGLLASRTFLETKNYTTVLENPGERFNIYKALYCHLNFYLSLPNQTFLDFNNVTFISI